MTIKNDTLSAVMPLPHTDTPASTLTLTFSLGSDQEGEGRLEIRWEIRPSASDGMRGRMEGAVNAGKEAGLDLVEAVRRIERALSS